MKKFIIITAIFMVLGGLIVIGARMPIVGGDSGVWGTLWNEVFLAGHTVNGTHANLSITGFANVTEGVVVGDSTASHTGLIVLRNGYFRAYNGSEWLYLGNGTLDTPWQTSGGNVYFSTGNVGIGTSTPNQKLVVIGTVNITQGLNVTGGLRVSGLASCDTVDTDAKGNFKCGTDADTGATGDTSASDDFNIANNASTWDRSVADDYTKANHSAEYALTGYKKANLTTDYPNLDLNKLDDFNWLNNLTYLLDNGTIIRTGATVNWDKNTADDWKLSNFTSAFEAEVPVCGAGDFLTADGTDISCDTPLGGGGGGASKWIDLGTKIMPNSTFAYNVFVNGTIEAKDWSNLTKQLKIQGYDINISDDFNNENFTTRYNLKTDRFGNGNFTSLFDIRETYLFKNANWTGQFNIYSSTLQNSSSAFKLANFTAAYNAKGDRYGKGNYSAEYALTGYKKANLTADYPNLDINTADDFNNANGTALYVLRTNSSIAVSNGTQSNFRIVEYNSTCSGFRFGTTGALILSCS